MQLTCEQQESRRQQRRRGKVIAGASDNPPAADNQAVEPNGGTACSAEIEFGRPHFRDADSVQSSGILGNAITTESTPDQ